MAKSAQFLRARELRRKAWSIGEIAQNLKVSKSSVSLWCRDMKLTLAQKKRIFTKAIQAGHKGRLLGAEVNRQKKLRVMNEYIQIGRTETATLTKKELLLIGAALYWGEGSKVGQLSFVNSDKDMVVFMLRWFQIALNVKREDVMPRIYVNEQHMSRKNVIENYWSTILSIPRSQFRPTIFIKRPQRKKYTNHSKYYGLLSLRFRSSTNMKYRIFGLIEGLKYSKF